MLNRLNYVAVRDYQKVKFHDYSLLRRLYREPVFKKTRGKSAP